jgi:hypothetical protein
MTADQWVSIIKFAIGAGALCFLAFAYHYWGNKKP